MGEFEVFDGTGGSPFNRKPQLSIRKDGAISMNRIVWERLGSPAYVLLLFDRKDRRVGIQVCEEDHRYAFKIAPPGSYRGDNTATVHAKTFCHRYHCLPQAAKRYPVRFENGMAIAALQVGQR